MKRGNCGGALTDRQRWLGWIVLLMLVAGHLTVALFPFRFDPPGYVENGVIGRAGHGLTFSGPNVVARTVGPAAWLHTAVRESSFTLELELRSSRARQYGPARVLDVSRDAYNADLVVGQFDSHLVVRLRRPGSGPGGTPELYVADALADREWHQIRIAVAHGRFTVRVDDAPDITHVVGDAALDDWDTSYRLSLGNAVAGNRPWRGDIRRAVIVLREEVVDLLAPGHLNIPPRTWYVPDRLDQLLGLGTATDRWLLLPRAVASAPLGVVTFLLWRRRTAAGLLAMALAALLLGIEVAKIAFENRHPSAVNVAPQWLGALLGMWVAKREVARRSSSAGATPGSG